LLVSGSQKTVIKKKKKVKNVLQPHFGIVFTEKTEFKGGVALESARQEEIDCDEEQAGRISSARSALASLDPQALMSIMGSTTTSSKSKLQLTPIPKKTKPKAKQSVEQVGAEEGKEASR
jgi:hypothetical protein